MIRMSGAVPGKPGTAVNEDISHQAGQNPPDEAGVRDLLGDEVLDALLERSRDADGGLRLTGDGSMLGDLVKAVLERALEGELSAHLGYGKHNPAGKNSGNSRNGTAGKTVQTGIGPVRLSVPRDRAGTFEPVLVPKRAGRIAGGLDDMIISLYAHGMTVRDILHHLNQVYGTELSPEQVSAITDGVLEEVKAWQNRVLDPAWPAVFLDALVVRCVLLPAVLELLGSVTWRLPRWLDARLPHINIEGSAARMPADPAIAGIWGAEVEPPARV